MRVCKECKFEKELEQFRPVKKGKYRSYQCRECRNKGLRTGRPNRGQYKKGHIATHSPFIKGMTPWNKDKYNGNSRGTRKNIVWKNAVKERDGNKCIKCGIQINLSCHHIKPWRNFPELRFEISNGMTLCKICHGKEEGPLNAENGINTRFVKGHKLSPESIEKMKDTKRLNFLKKKG